MALFQSVSVTVTSLGGGDFNIAVGPEGYVVDLPFVADCLAGRRKTVEMLIHQIALGLDAAGFTRASFLALTPLQQKNAIQALVLKW